MAGSGRSHVMRAIQALFALCVAGSTVAEQLGTIGPVYPIAEPSFLAFIEEQIKEKQRTGELARLEEKARAKSLETIRNPAPIAGLVATAMPRTFYVDPTYELDRNIVDQDGRVLFPAGTRKNPLEIVALSKHLLFFDARDERQVIKAKALLQHYQGRVKPILVGGSFLELMKEWRVPVYYDQRGTLTSRLGIRQVPALVSQEGLSLRIDEIAL